MFRIRLTTGTETVFESFDEFAKAVATGTVSEDASIWHDRAAQWLPVSVHPAYRRAIESGVVPGSQAPPAAPPPPAPEPPPPPPELVVEAEPEPEPKPEPEEQFNSEDLRHLLDLDAITEETPEAEQEEEDRSEEATPVAEGSGDASDAPDSARPVSGPFDETQPLEAIAPTDVESLPLPDEDEAAPGPASDLPLISPDQLEPLDAIEPDRSPAPTADLPLIAPDPLEELTAAQAAREETARADEPESESEEESLPVAGDAVEPAPDVSSDDMELTLADSMLDLKAIPDSDAAEEVQDTVPAEDATAAAVPDEIESADTSDVTADEARTEALEPLLDEEPAIETPPERPADAEAKSHEEAGDESPEVEAPIPEHIDPEYDVDAAVPADAFASTDDEFAGDDIEIPSTAETPVLESAAEVAAPTQEGAALPRTSGEEILSGRPSITVRTAPVLGESFRRRQAGMPTWVIVTFVVIALAVLGWFGRGLFLGSDEGDGAPAGTETPDQTSAGGEAPTPTPTPPAQDAVTDPPDSAALVQAYVDGYRAARNRLQSALSSVSFSGLLAPSRLGDADSLAVARGAVRAALGALQAYRDTERTLEASRPAGQPPLEESDGDAARADIFLEGMTNLVDFLINQAGQYRLLNGALLFQDSTLQSQYNLVREVVVQQLATTEPPPASIARLVATTDSVPVPISTFLTPIDVPVVAPPDTSGIQPDSVQSDTLVNRTKR